MNSIRVLYRLIKGERLFFGITIMIIMFVSSFALVIPMAIKILLDYVIVNKIENLLLYFFISILILVLGRLVLMFIQDYIVAILRQRLERKIYLDYINEILRIKIDKYYKLDSGDILNRLTTSLNNIQYFLIRFIYYLFYAIFISTSVFIIMYFINIPLFFLMVGFYILHMVNFIGFSPLLDKTSNNYYKTKSKTSTFLVQFFDGYVQIIVSWLQKDFISDLKWKVKKLYLHYFKREVFSFSQRTFQNFLITSNIILIIYIGGKQIINGEMLLGTLMFFQLLVGYLYEPIYQLSEINRILKDATVQLNRLYEIIDLEEKEIVSDQSNQLDKVEVNKIEFRNVFFSYEKDQTIFKDLSYTFKQGNIYMVFGKSGEGKTTLFNILSALYKVEKGNIYINNKNYNNYSLENIRNKISVNMQDDLLFSGTVSDNITTFEQTSDDQKVRRVADLSKASQFIYTLPHQYNSYLEEGGENLSGGQKQRIALARTLYDDKDVMLFDEPTASLDEVNEELFLKNLNQIKSNKIIIIISHKIKLKKYCDEVLELKNGKLKKIKK